MQQNQTHFVCVCFSKRNLENGTETCNFNLLKRSSFFLIINNDFDDMQLLEKAYTEK